MGVLLSLGATSPKSWPRSLPAATVTIASVCTKPAKSAAMVCCLPALTPTIR